MPDLLATLGLDDGEFHSAMRRSQGSVNDYSGRFGSMLKSQTAGIRNLISGIKSTAIAVGGLGVAATGVLALIERWSKAQSDHDDLVFDEVMKRRAITNEIALANTELSALKRTQLEINIAAGDRLAQLTEEAQTIAYLVGRTNYGYGIDRLFEWLNDDGRAAEQMQQRLDAILKLMKLIRKQRDENSAKAAQDAAKRDAEEKKRAEAEKRRIEFDNKMSEDQMEVERLRLTMKDKEADALEREIEHKRRIREIEDRSGLSDADRARLIGKENALFALRNAAANRIDPVQQETPAIRQLSTGLSANSTLIGQVFGTRGQQVQNQQKKMGDDITAIRKVIVDGGAGRLSWN